MTDQGVKFETLRGLSNGETATVRRFITEDLKMENELREIGFAEGDEVELLEKGAFGSPVSVRLNRTIIALRAHEADAIEVERL